MCVDKTGEGGESNKGVISYNSPANNLLICAFSSRFSSGINGYWIFIAIFSVFSKSFSVPLYVCR